ncbi:MAG TPA: TonB-dependent receptor [Woeseiaceae bacterium]|nr:TonB-dependent receptor [Woeseiaceae bacterium]
MRGNVTTRFIAAGVAVVATVAGPEGTANAQAQERSILEEIVVTAQRREENIQDVPISVTAVRGEQLETLFAGGEDVRALAARVPSLYAESSNGRLAPRFYMRGLGNSDFDLAASQSVSVVVDEVVQENVILKSFPLFDLDRVEVLRGPQGSLFGRNTPAGIIKFETRKPTAELDGYAAATVGSLGTLNFEGALGGALNESETLLARLSVLSQNRDDWIDNGFTGESDVMGSFSENAFRLQLLAQPSDAFSALFNVHGRDLNNGTASVFRANILDPGSNSLNENFDRDKVFFDGGNNNPQEARALGGSVRLDFDFGNEVTLTSISSYETVENRSLGDIDGGNLVTGPGFIPFPSETQDGLEDLEQLTQEFRLASDANDRLFWQAGLFWFDSDFSVQTWPFFVPPTTVRHENQSWAAFGQLSFDLGDRTTLTAGVRYTDDDKDMTTPETPNPQPPVSVSDEQVSWDLSLSFAMSDDVNIFGRVASGFRAPSIQGRNIAFFDPNPFSIANSETILSTEIGFKSTPTDQFRLNGSVYYYTIDDQQLSAIGGNTNSNVLVNADKGKGMGVDLDAELLFSDNFVMTFGGSYNDTEIDDPNLVTAVCAQCTVLDPLDTNGFAILDGNPFPQAPEFMINATARLSASAGDNDEVYLFADVVHQGDTNFFLYESAEYHSGDIFEAGLRAGYIANDGQWELSVFARNITDEENLKGGIDFNNLTGFVNEPRIFGLTFQMNFGEF